MAREQSHVWDDDAICIYCGMDGAEQWHLDNNLRLEVGDDEFNYRRAHNDTGNGPYHCDKRPEKNA